jgi:hypothetical protein
VQKNEAKEDKEMVTLDILNGPHKEDLSDKVTVV